MVILCMGIKFILLILNVEVENPTIWLMNILQTEEENNETDGN